MIMAHKNVKQLCHLVEYFSRDCYVFIHLDKKFKVGREGRENYHYDWEALLQVLGVKVILRILVR